MKNELEVLTVKEAKAKGGPMTLAYTTREAPGALPNGTRVVKTESKPDDTHQDGAGAVIIGSAGPTDADPDHKGAYAYFVEWDDMPGVPVGTTSWRIKRA